MNSSKSTPCVLASANTTNKPIEPSKYEEIKEPSPWIPSNFDLIGDTFLQAFNSECKFLINYLKCSAKEEIARNIFFEIVKRRIQKYDQYLHVNLIHGSSTGLFLTNSAVQVSVWKFPTEKGFKINNEQRVFDLFQCFSRLFNQYKPLFSVLNGRNFFRISDPNTSNVLQLFVSNNDSEVQKTILEKKIAAQLPGFSGLMMILKQYLENRKLFSTESDSDDFGLHLWVGAFQRVHESLYIDVSEKSKIEESDPETTKDHQSNPHHADAKNNLILPFDLSKNNYPEKVEFDNGPEDFELMLLNFFHFFGYCFDYENIAIAPLGYNNDQNRIFIPKDEISIEKQLKFVILNPLDQRENAIDSTSFGAAFIPHFRSSYRLIIQSLDSNSLKIKKNGILWKILNVGK